MESLIAYFVRRPLLVNLLTILFIVAGVMALRTLQYNSYPPADTGVIVVSTAYPGASAEDVELSVTVPLEQELLHVDGVDKVVSSSMEGISNILVHGYPDDSIDKYDEVEADLQNAIDRAMGSLPDNLPQIKRPESTKRIPLMQVLVSGSVPEETLRRIAKTLQLDIRGIEGVSGVSKEGYRDREVKVMLDEARIRQLGLSYDQVINAVLKRNVRDAGGSLESFAGQQDILTIGKFENPKDIEQVILFDKEPGNSIRIQDVATVVYGYADPVVRSRVDGKKAISLNPRASESADGLSTAKRVKAFVESRKAMMPADVKLTIVNDTSRTTTDMLDVLVGNAIAGIVLVFLVLLAFFQLRLTIWVVLGIPTSILMVFAVMPVLGLTVNVLSMAALILMLGILVDDAVVTAESIFRHREYGMSPNDAAIAGTHKVALPVLASAVTTIVALAPAAFLGGIQGKIMWVIPVMAILVLVMSLFECKFILPSHISHGIDETNKQRLSRPWFEWVENAYESLMMKIVPRRYLFAAVLTLVFVAMAFVASKLVVINLSPETNTDVVFIKAEGPIGTSFEAMEQKLQSLEALARSLIPPEDLENIVSTTGHHDHNRRKITEGQDVSWGLVSIFLKPNNQREINALDLQTALNTQLKQRDDFRRLSVRLKKETIDMGWPLEMHVISNGDERFIVADMIVEYVNSLHPGIKDVWTNYAAGKPVISLKLDYDALARFNLTVGDVSAAVKVAFNGKIIDTFETIDETITYRLHLDGVDISDPAALLSIVVNNHQGKPILLRSLVEFEQRPGEATVSHYLGDRATTVYADTDRTRFSTEALNAAVQQFVVDQKILQRFPDISIQYGGEMESSAEQAGSMADVLLLSLFGIMFILILLFNSIIQPFMVMLLIPLGVIGVFFVFGLQGLPMSMTALIGIAGLMGVIINDALVMLDRFNVERKLHTDKTADDDGITRFTLLHDRQVVECASVRLRPIVITTVTTVAGLFPAAYGLSGSNDLITPMVMVMLWGVLLASLTTLFLLPCLFAMEQDLLGKFNSDVRKQSLDEVIMYN